jgi:hypothetical protein
MERFVVKPRRPEVVYAARFRRGYPLDDVREVARKHDGDAAVVLVPALDVVVVRSLKVPDHHPSYDDYTIVQNGHWLVYAEAFDLLYETSDQAFGREHEKGSW